MKLRIALAAVAAMTAFVGTACAHAILMASTPAIGGTAATGAGQISLRYNSLIDVERSRVVLTDPAGGQSVLKLAPVPNGDGITAGVVLQAGHNTLRWQVLAVDGHITRGDVPFEVGRGRLAQDAVAGR